MPSFALEFRKKYFLEADRPPRGRRRYPTRAETRASRAGALGAFMVAAAMLAAFNSEGLRTAMRDLAGTELGRSLLAAAEVWDGAMERAGAKRVVAGVRVAIGEARTASWSDLAGVVEAPVLALRNEKEVDAPSADKTITGALPASATGL
jgi:hypothetical protein